jgi:hypothetical protein
VETKINEKNLRLARPRELVHFPLASPPLLHIFKACAPSLSTRKCFCIYFATKLEKRRPKPSRDRIVKNTARMFFRNDNIMNASDVANMASDKTGDKIPFIAPHESAGPRPESKHSKMPHCAFSTRFTTSFTKKFLFFDNGLCGA